MTSTTTSLAPLSVGSRVVITKGCKDLGVTKGSTVIVTGVRELGPEYSYQVQVQLKFLNSFLSGKTISVSATHINRLSDASVRLHGLVAGKTIEVRRK